MHGIVLLYYIAIWVQKCAHILCCTLHGFYPILLAMAAEQYVM